jgi:hypothetical protein
VNRLHKEDFLCPRWLGAGSGHRAAKRLRKEVFDAEMRANEAFAIRAERLLVRNDIPTRNRSFWR